MKKYNLGQKANWGGLVKELGCQIVTQKMGSEDELKTVVTHEFEDDNLAFVRDIFVFVCFTALSFIDVKNLTTDNIVDINGDKWIISKRHKTNIPFQVKLMEVPLQIIDRYKHLQEDKLVFGKMNYWSMCKKLKTVITACGIEEH